MNKKNIESIAVQGKKVLVRCDFNVPLDADKNITDETRILGALPTIKYLVNQGARVILCSHLGRPKGEVNPKYSLAPVAKRLSEHLGKEVKMAAEVIGDSAKALTAEMQDGDVVLRCRILESACIFGRSICKRCIRHSTPCPCFHRRRCRLSPGCVRLPHSEGT